MYEDLLKEIIKNKLKLCDLIIASLPEDLRIAASNARGVILKSVAEAIKEGSEPGSDTSVPGEKKVNSIDID